MVRPKPLSGAQIQALENYFRTGLTAQSLCRSHTFNSLVRRGFLRCSHGLGPIEAELTDAGYKALGFRLDDAN